VSWIRNLIIYCHKNAKDSAIALSNARVHEIRALAASTAWKANLSLDDILTASSWKQHTTFTDFYLRDICLIQDDLHSLGPLAVSQQVVTVPGAHQ